MTKPAHKPVKRLTKEDVRSMREKLGMTGEAFGAYLADLVGAERPYTRQEVSHWETGLRPLPTHVELAVVRQRLDACEKARRRERRNAT